MDGVTHSVIYHENDIEMPNSTCIEMRHSPANISEGNIHFSQSDGEQYDRPMSHYWGESDDHRMRREVSDDIEEEKENTCILLIHVDHMFVSGGLSKSSHSILRPANEVTIKRGSSNQSAP